MRAYEGMRWDYFVAELVTSNLHGRAGQSANAPRCIRRCIVQRLDLVWSRADRFIRLRGPASDRPATDNNERWLKSHELAFSTPPCVFACSSVNANRGASNESSRVNRLPSCMHTRTRNYCAAANCDTTIANCWIVRMTRCVRQRRVVVKMFLVGSFFSSPLLWVRIERNFFIFIKFVVLVGFTTAGRKFFWEKESKEPKCEFLSLVNFCSCEIEFLFDLFFCFT